MKVAVVGLGLMGCSMALAMREKGFSDEFFGVDSDIVNCEESLKLGIVNSYGKLDEIIPKSDFVIIATPVNVIKKILPKVLDLINKNAIVVDLGSTKYEICKSVESHKNRTNFIALHPIAGTENSGPKSAFAKLYNDKICIICQREKSDKTHLEKLEEILISINMRLAYMGAKNHDLHIAFVSHLSHISSFSLGKTVLDLEKSEDNIFNMAGSGFESTVRLAKSSPVMWSPIFIQNKKNLLTAIELYQKNIDKMKSMIENDDFDKLEEYMRQANDIRKILK